MKREWCGQPFFLGQALFGSTATWKRAGFAAATLRLFARMSSFAGPFEGIKITSILDIGCGDV